MSHTQVQLENRSPLIIQADDDGRLIVKQDTDIIILPVEEMFKFSRALWQATEAYFWNQQEADNAS